MNLGDVDLHSVHYHQPHVQHGHSRYSISASNGALSHSDPEYAADTESVSAAETVVRWETPQERQRQTYEHAQSEATLKPLKPPMDLSIHVPETSATASLDRNQRRAGVAATMQRPITVFRESDTTPPTPNDDDTPFILYAINQLTRDRNVEASQRPATETTLTSDDTYPVQRMISDEGLGYLQPRAEIGRTQSVKRVERPALVDIRPSSAQTDLFIPVRQLDSPRYPSLTFKPKILRPLSLITLLVLCVLMIAALISCAAYSSSNRGLVDFAGSITGSQYFLFQFLPQILAAVIQFYVEAVTSAVARVVPFVMMASDSRRRRSKALFLGLYSTSLILPRFDYLTSGEPFLGVCSLLLWPIFFTIPLQSCLFSVIYVDGIWRWTTVQGIAWILAAIYIMALVSLIGIALYFHRRATGLIWDPRSLADIIALLPRSNSFNDYFETEVMPQKSDIQVRLTDASPRLGYWRTRNDLQEIFYCIGEEGAQTRRYTMQAGQPTRMPSYLSRRVERPYEDLEAGSPNVFIKQNTGRIPRYSPYACRHRYIPWYLHASLVLLWPLAAFFLLLALIVVTSLPSIAFKNGFPPRVDAAPNSAGFSPANFLYSFIPSILGIMIYSSFRSLSRMICRLTPWDAMSDADGAIASKSLLIDYAASFPVLGALANGHGLVALLSVLSFVNILLPILAGGLFFPFQLLPSGTVAMVPNLPAFYVIIVILILDFFGLVYLMIHFLSTETGYHLPHPVSCLAEIFSFIYASDIAQDAAFRGVKSKADLRTRLVGRRERTIGGVEREEMRYVFGIFRGKDREDHIGIRRLRRESLEGEESKGVIKAYSEGRVGRGRLSS